MHTCNKLCIRFNIPKLLMSFKSVVNRSSSKCAHYVILCNFCTQCTLDSCHMALSVRACNSLQIRVITVNMFLSSTQPCCITWPLSAPLKSCYLFLWICYFNNFLMCLKSPLQARIAFLHCSLIEKNPVERNGVWRIINIEYILYMHSLASHTLELLMAPIPQLLL